MNNRRIPIRLLINYIIPIWRLIAHSIKIKLIFFLFFLSISAFSQTQKFIFQSIQQGLSNRYVRCIFKDSRGFMWFGTQNGLTKYDGVNFVVYENSVNDTNSLSYNNISSIIEDKYKNLWIGTFGGLNLYDREKDHFIRIKPAAKFVISALCEDDNNIWIGTIGAGMVKYDVKNNTIEYFRHNVQNINSINSNHISSVVKDKWGRLWVGTLNGLDLFNIKENKIHHFVNEANDKNSLSNNSINTLFLDNNGALWIGTISGGVNRLMVYENRLSFERYLYSDGTPSINILSLYGDKYNNLWIGTEHGGLNRLDINSGKIERYKKEDGNTHSLSSNTVRSVYIDDLGIIWIGSFNKGLNFVDKRFNRFEVYRKNVNSALTLCGDEVRKFTKDKNGNVWVATDGGICRFNINSRQFTKSITRGAGGLSIDEVTAVIVDSEDNLWVGTWGGGIDRFDKNFKKTANYKIRGFLKAGDDKLLSLYKDNQDNIWAGSAGTGLFLFDKSKQAFVQVYDELAGGRKDIIGYVNSILQDSNNDIWVTTMYRLFRLRNKGNNKYSFESFLAGDAPGSIQSNSISVLYEDSKKNIWVGSVDKGLSLYDRKNNSFISFDIQEEVPASTICGILEDTHGHLWISTNNGLSRFDISAKKYRNYAVEDGLVSNEFNWNSCLKTETGEFFFGTSNGFNVFNPDRISDNRIVQPICLTDFKLFNKSVKIGTEGSPLGKSISETRKIVLSHKQSSFTIDFVALNYIQGSKSQYAYILEGLESEWNMVAHKNSASYTYVKPGKYLFKVKGSNNDGVWNDTPVTLEIVILPPFWQTPWAYIFYVLVLLGVIIAFLRYRITRAKQIHLIELNRMKLQFFANISHELRTPLSLILSPIESILVYAKQNKDIKDKLELIYRNSTRLFRLVNEIMDFTKAEESKLTLSAQLDDIVKFTKEISSFFSDEALRRQINYRVIAEPANIEAWFDRDKFEKIILNLLSNAFKFTPDQGSIEVKIEKTFVEEPAKGYKNKTGLSSGGFVKISVIDNGKGISPDEMGKVFERFYQGGQDDYTYQVGTGIGLSLSKTLVELHHGKIYVTSEKWKETCFTILLPLGNNHLSKSEMATEHVDIGNYIPESKTVDPESVDIPKVTGDAPTILVVEDNYELRKYILSTLAVKYKMLEASDGEMGYKAVIEYMPDLIISDIIMPNLSGTQLCKKLKGNIITSHIPVILLTAKVTLEDQINGIETGADAYITKPFNVRYLEVVTKNLIETRQKLFQRFSQEVYILPKEISSNALDQTFLENIIKYVEDNILSAELSVENLSAYLLMSPGHTWRKIKSLTGQSTNEFIRTIRLKKAIKLIEENNLNVSEIAYKVGFSSPAYFTKCFREQYGKSPSAYFSEKRKKNKDE